MLKDACPAGDNTTMVYGREDAMVDALYSYDTTMVELYKYYMKMPLHSRPMKAHTLLINTSYT